LNEDGWPVVAPHRYAGETIGKYGKKDVAGVYRLVNHGKDISADIKPSVAITLESDGSITGASAGTWKLSDGNEATLTLDGVSYTGVFVRQWDESSQTETMAFTVLSEGGTAVWGSRVSDRKEQSN
jgi:arabinan endo-1,5-alpha-L-arabinosidase